MTALIIDTSTNSAIVALSKNGVIVCCKNISNTNRLSKSFVPLLDSLLNEFRISLQDLNYIAVGIGPGSYTGTRVGVVVAQTLSFALQKPLVTFCSLKAFLPVTLGCFAWVMPSKSQDFYVLRGVRTLIGLEEGFYHHLIPKEELSIHLEGATYVISCEIENIPHSYPKAVYLEAELNCETLGLIVHNKFLNGVFSSESQADLLYLH